MFNNGSTLQKRFIFSVVEKRIPQALGGFVSSMSDMRGRDKSSQDSIENAHFDLPCTSFIKCGCFYDR